MRVLLREGTGEAGGQPGRCVHVHVKPEEWGHAELTACMMMIEGVNVCMWIHTYIYIYIHMYTCICHGQAPKDLSTHIRLASLEAFVPIITPIRGTYKENDV